MKNIKKADTELSFLATKLNSQDDKKFVDTDNAGNLKEGGYSAENVKNGKEI